VVAVDRSRRFLDALTAAARERGLTQIETRELDLDEAGLPELRADGVWSRWVYAFVRNPRRLLEGAARLLRPGGTMVLHEYLDYRAWRTSPRSPEFEGFVDEVIARWLSEMGFELRALEPLVEIARPGDFVWQWPKAYVEAGTRRLADLGRISEERASAIRSAFVRVEADPHAFQITPTVIEIIAVRR
jgi:SAM-dependent methyltransferase